MPHPFIPIAGGASVELIYSMLGEVIENQLHVKKSADFTFAQIQAMRAVFDTWDNDSWKGTRPVGCTLNRIRTRALHDAAAPTEDFNLVAPRAGQRLGLLYPSNVTFALKLATGLTGRSYRGRIYVPGLTSDSVIGNQTTPAVAALYINSLALLQTRLTAWDATAQLCVASFYTNGAWRTVGVCTPITGVVATDYNLDSQRRRLTGRGHT